MLKGGRHKIRIAICHKTETCYIITKYSIDNSSQFKNGQVVKRPDASIVNTKLRGLLNMYQERLDNIQNEGMYSCQQIKDILTRHECTQKLSTFKSVCDDYISELEKNGKTNYADMIGDSTRYFLSFTKGDLALTDITPELIEKYAGYIKKKKWSAATIGIHLRNVRTIINRAIKKRKVSYEVHPFIDCSIQQSPVRDVNISLESLNRILNADLDSKALTVAKDLFSLSFYLGGMNMIDLMNADFSDLNNIRYVRAKIEGRSSSDCTIVIPIHDKAKSIIRKWLNSNTGKLDFGYNFSVYKNFSRHVSRAITNLSKELNIKERVVYYSARKTFAQIASELGIPDSVIDYCLGHSDRGRGVIRYYTKVKEKQAEIAINRVIDYVENPDKYKEYIEMRADIMMRI